MWKLKEMADSTKSKSYTVIFEDDEIEILEKMSDIAGVAPEDLLRYAMVAYTFITTAIANGSTLYLDDSEIVLDFEDDEVEFTLEIEDDPEEDEDPEENSGVKLTVFRVIEGGRKD